MKKRKLGFSLYFSLLILFLAPFSHSTKLDLDVPITLDVKGMDILDVLKIISLRSGLSIATSPLVRGKVTIFLKDVSVWDAFEILIAANNLAYEKRGNLINVMTNREYEEKYGHPFYDLRILKRYKLKNAKAELVGKTLDELKSKIGKVIVDNYSNSVIVLDTPDVIYEMDKVIKELDIPLVTKVIQLNYAQVKDIEGKINDLITPEIGSIKFDEGSNRIVVADLPYVVERIERIAKAFDKRPKAVLIEAKIIKITLSDEYRYGIDWEVIFGKEAGISYAGTLPTGVGGIGKLAIGEVVFNEDQRLTTKHQYRGLLKLFNSFGKVDILSSPRITVLDGQEAYMLVGTKEPVISVSITYPETGETLYTEHVDYVETGVRLSVTPYISEEGYIRMRIKPEVSSAEYVETERGSKYPKKTTSEAETTLIVRDGTTIVLAGLMKEEKERRGEKIPGLGDLPLVGKLFSGKYEREEKTELVILLTPKIMEEEKVAVKEETTSMREQRSLVKGGFRATFEKGSITKGVREALIQEGERKLYSEYYLQVVNKIYNYIEQNYLKPGLKGEINVVFLLDRKGKLIGKPAVIGDVDPAIRDLVIEVIKGAGPYPPFPEGLKKDKQAFNVLISF